MATDPVSEKTDDEGDDAAFGEWVEEADEGSPDAEADGPELSVFQSDDEEPSDDEEASTAMVGQSGVDIGMGDSAIAAGSRLDSMALEASPSLLGDPFASIGREAALAHDAESHAEPEPSFEAMGGDDTVDDATVSATTFDFGEAVGLGGASQDASQGDPEESGHTEDHGEAEDANSFPFMSADHDAAAGEVASEDEPEGSFSFENAIGEAAASEESSDLEDPMGAAAVTAAGAPPKTGKKAARPAPARKKKPSMVGQMIGMIVGGAMSIPIVLAILWWGVGKDPLKVAPMVPDSLGFILPAKLRSGGQIATATGSGQAPSLDDVLGGGGPDAGGTDVVITEPEPEMEPAFPEPEPIEPSATDLASVTPPPTPSDDGGDPLADLLNEGPETPPDPPQPSPVPKPEPLDTAALETAAEKALASLAAVKSVDDPSDPVLKKLLVECYRSLAGYAQELAMLERVAADSGRTLEAMPPAVDSMNEALASRPELIESLTRLTRDWMAYSRRSSDGVVAPVRFVSARRVGPYWRAEVTLGERPIVVLTRSEPAVASGETVIVTGLTVDKDVVWATQVKPAKAADSLFGP
jgi:hypothetical protein